MSSTFSTGSPDSRPLRRPRRQMGRQGTDALDARQAFFAAATHDLKAPLTSLSLWIDSLEVLKPRLAAAADAHSVALLDQALDQMHTLVRRSIHLVDDILDATRREAGQPLPFAPSEVDLVALVRQILEQRPEDSDHLLRLEAAQSELWGWWDADRLARLVENLLTNAIKYSPVGRPVIIRVADDETESRACAVLEVEDRGVGIPAAELQHIFEPFHRAQNVTLTTAGLGLGLWGCRAIAEQHGGTLVVASREGEGTTVAVRLPLTPTSPTPR